MVVLGGAVVYYERGAPGDGTHSLQRGLGSSLRRVDSSMQGVEIESIRKMLARAAQAGHNK